jgi:hypothetical protein
VRKGETYKAAPTNLIELGRDAKASFGNLGRFISNVFSYTGMNNWLAEKFIAKKVL